MRQRNNKFFKAMLTIARTSLINNNNVAVIINKVAITMPIYNRYENIVIIQRNAIRSTITKLQVECFAKANNQDIILFLVHYFRIKGDGGLIIENTKLLTI